MSGRRVTRYQRRLAEQSAAQSKADTVRAARAAIQARAQRESGAMSKWIWGALACSLAATYGAKLPSMAAYRMPLVVVQWGMLGVMIALSAWQWLRLSRARAAERAVMG